MALTVKPLTPEEEARRQAAQGISNQALAEQRTRDSRALEAQKASNRAFFDNPAVRMYEFGEMSPQTQGVVRSAAGYSGALNAQYSPTLPEIVSSKYSVPSFPAAQLGVGMGSQITEANRPSFQPQSLLGGNQPTPQQLPSIQQQIPFKRTAIETPYGTIYATSEAPKGQMSQAEAFASRPTAFVGRTPEQQQAALAQVRQNGQKIASNYLQTMATFAQDRKENTPTYTTFSGNAIKAPTNMFGQPIESWAKIYEKSSAANEAALAKIRGQGETTRNGIAITPVGGPQPAKATQPQRPSLPQPSLFPTQSPSTILNTFGSPLPLGATPFPIAGVNDNFSGTQLF